MSRKVARTYAYQLVFESLFNKDDQIAKENIFKDPTLTLDDSNYIETVVNGVNQNYNELIELISRNTANFKFERIFKPDLAILLLATYEMKYIPNIPKNVSINEAVELAKVNSTEKSPQFVNGVLSGIYKELNKC
ncbi:MAG: transcription antitermination factor NusB [Christensenella sp.]|nr:transcription antitermination factor NusB [Christensenella sp.]